MKMVKSLAVIGLTCFASIANAADRLTVYSYRQAFLIDPILENFTKETGVKVDVVFSKKGIAERMVREGRLSKADIVLTSDFYRLMELVEKDLVVPASSDILKQNIPAKYRSPDDEWYALTMRVRNIYSSKDRLGKLDINYEDLADPKYKGKICTRSGKHPYNVSLVASMIAHHGEQDTKTWLEGWKANLARKPQGNDRAQVKAVSEGLCDLAIGNSYYLGKMLQNPDQKQWADAIEINFPNQDNRGSHINVSGMALAKHSKNQAVALQLMEYLSGNQAQQAYAEVNFEYPVKADVQPSELVASWGTFKADDLPIYKLAEYHGAAIKLLDEVKFDL
ncbi:MULTISPECIES: Fe(3+) ABC transporter substrate-binding protein [unclassified Shewanella]|uniref:Fe(3+) ABC transporter substrate-binding protein n=1 Tax=unclassified Shewanella TaxID=196818 RepID=UPI001BB8BD20|nr:MULTISPECIES: Fe(3+) ABC transporter substrate-binding protein [unclassified Shewanella]GIU11776.1 iron ABC transporter substrate-binding protein [Shewanella sp. MBTL60-112-B1]GIU32083.1 iron ABC transporter substrate-binding protein [Shewanella sp. MBTL60-112-B2]